MALISDNNELLDEAYFRIFLESTEEYIQYIEEHLLDLEKDPDNQKNIREIFRCIHSIKGDSGLLGLKRVEKITHEMENILDHIREGRLSITSDILDLIFQGTEFVKCHVKNIVTGIEKKINDEDIVTALQSINPSDRRTDHVKIESHYINLNEINQEIGHKKNTPEIIPDTINYNKYLIFKLANQQCAIPIHYVQEVIDIVQFTKVPYVEDYIEGVINLRGYIIPVIDLYKRCNLPQLESIPQNILIINNNKNKIGLKLDDVYSVEELDKNNIYTSEQCFLGMDHQFVSGVIKQNEQLIFILKLDKIIDRGQQIIKNIS